MLVLTRKIGETVRLTTAAGDVIEVVVRKARKGETTLGFAAPASVVIWRAEVAERMAVKGPGG